MAQTYRTTRAITVRGRRFEKGVAYAPESEDDALQLLHLHLIERTHPPNAEQQEVKPDGGNH